MRIFIKLKSGRRIFIFISYYIKLTYTYLLSYKSITKCWFFTYYLFNELLHHIRIYDLLSMGGCRACKKYINWIHQCGITIRRHLLCILFASSIQAPQGIEIISSTSISYGVWDTPSLLYHNIMFNYYEYLDLHIFWNGKDLHPYWVIHLALLPYFWTAAKVFTKRQRCKKYFTSETGLIYLYSCYFAYFRGKSINS